MNKYVAAAGIGAALALSASGALAQEIGRQGDAVLSAERLFGFHSTNRQDEFELGNGNRVERDRDTTGFGIGWRGTAQPSPFDAARVGFDYFIIDSLSLGGALGYVSYDADDDDDDDDFEYAQFIIAFRVGYLFNISDNFGFWLRGGLTTYKNSFDGDNNDEGGTALTGEGMFAWSPVPGAAILFGPTFDLEFLPMDDDDDNDREVRYRSLGITAGLAAWF